MQEDSVSKIEEEFTETFQALKLEVDALVFKVNNLEKIWKTKDPNKETFLWLQANLIGLSNSNHIIKELTEYLKRLVDINNI